MTTSPPMEAHGHSATVPSGLGDPDAPCALEGFACPQEGLSREALRFVVGEHAQAYARLFVDRSLGQLTSRSRGLEPFLEAWLAGPASWKSAWDSVHGMVRQAVLQPSGDPLPVLAQLGLALSAAGEPGEWGIELHSCHRFRFGRWVLPPSVAVRFEGRGGERSILTCVDGEGRVTEHALRAEALAGPGSVELPRLRSRGWEALLWSSAGEDAYGAGIEGFASEQISLDEIRDLCIEAMELLHEHAPPYESWVARVVREIMPIHSEEGMIRSYNGDLEHPGRVAMSFPSSPVVVAEMLVHEATHFYFSIAQHLDTVVNGTDQELYDSPIKGTQRPLDRILYAYHAFANVALFYQSCIESGESVDHCRSNLARHMPELDVLRRGLERTRGLTDLGRALWLPLGARLERLRA